ncbi:MAG: NUDIX domain-containing protein [Chromatiales bacterium]
MTAQHCYRYPHPAVTTDVVVFTIREERLKILLIRRGAEPFRGMWALPGGFLEIGEDLETCAKRELEEETGISGLYLEQLYTFGDPHRDPRERVISVTYFALVPSGRLELRASSDADQADWFPVDALPELAFDHREIIALARRRLKAKLHYSTIAFQLMPECFTLGELQRVYEVLLDEPQDKRNFRKWMLGLDQIEETGELRHNGRSRPARTYRLRNPHRVEIIR